MSGLNWCEVKVKILAEYGEIVAEIFQEEGSGGVIFDDPGILKEKLVQDDECLDKEFILPEQFGVRSYFPVDDRLGERLARIKRRIRETIEAETEFELKQVKEEDWAEAWKQYFKPERIGKIVIKPSWEEYSPANGEIVIELDPGMAFGTGTHPTTRLCLELLQEIITPQTKMLDVGSGSGILALAGAKLGAQTITAIDIDPVAVKVALENIKRNRMEGLIRVYEGNLLDRPFDSKFNLVVANIISNAIIEISSQLTKVLEPGGIFLASGIIEERYAEVLDCLTQQGFSHVKNVFEEGWAGLIVRAGF
jgi:ribosomal protein L11 methyltransferase